MRISAGDCTRSIRPGTPLGCFATSPDKSVRLPPSDFSTLRKVIGNAGSAFSSTMPKRAANLASGGALSVLTVSGKRFALVSVRPASSFTPSGSASWNVVRSGNGAGNVT